MKQRWPFLVSAAAALLSLALSSCGDEELTSKQVFGCPSKSSFTGVPEGGGTRMAAVSAYIERRCGTLDCHGSAEIPMRLHGQLGRRDALEGNIPGGAATTDKELDANYGAMCNVEPEKTAAQVDDFGQSAEELLIVRKARGIEGHKGGTIVREGDAADQCIVGWLRGLPLDQVAPNCQAAIDKFD